ncbi:MAG: hypothetical protein ABI947_27955 [Chloroflexota bacterium]
MIKLKDTLFRPTVMLLISLAITLLFALFVIVLIKGEKQRSVLIYDTPVIFPFVLFIFDRLKRLNETSFKQKCIDGLVLPVAIARAILPVPLVSGHALFLTYAILSVRLTLARYVAILVIFEVIYFKVTGHDLTVVGGIALGLTMALVFRKFSHNSSNLFISDGRG